MHSLIMWCCEWNIVSNVKCDVATIQYNYKRNKKQKWNKNQNTIGNDISLQTNKMYLLSYMMFCITNKLIYNF